MPSPTNAPAPPPALVASAEGELPADIVKAIDKFEAAAWDHGFGRRMQSSDPASRAVLTATILSRLAAAESARDEAVERAETAEFLQRAAQSTRDAFEVDLSAALARAERAEKALEPFAAWIGKLEPEYGDHADDVIAGGVGDAVVTFGDLRGARAALAHPATAEET